MGEPERRTMDLEELAQEVLPRPVTEAIKEIDFAEVDPCGGVDADPYGLPPSKPYGLEETGL